MSDLIRHAKHDIIEMAKKAFKSDTNTNTFEGCLEAAAEALIGAITDWHWVVRRSNGVWAIDIWERRDAGAIESTSVEAYRKYRSGGVV